MELQLDAFAAAGAAAEHIYTDHASDTLDERPRLAALLAQLRPATR